jgi:hypothetical protein
LIEELRGNAKKHCPARMLALKATIELPDLPAIEPSNGLKFKCAAVKYV